LSNISLFANVSYGFLKLATRMETNLLLRLGYLDFQLLEFTLIISFISYQTMRSISITYYLLSFYHLWKYLLIFGDFDDSLSWKPGAQRWCSIKTIVLLEFRQILSLKLQNFLIAVSLNVFDVRIRQVYQNVYQVIKW
jgi:hypothetical protein